MLKNSAGNRTTHIPLHNNFYSGPFPYPISQDFSSFWNNVF